MSSTHSKKYKTGLITGANRGIGLEFIKQLLKKDFTHLIATCRDPDSANELNELASKNKNLSILKLDVKNYDGYDDFFKSVSNIVGDEGLYLLINNAGIYVTCNLDNATPDKLIENFNVNTVAPLIITKTLLPLLKLSSANKTSNTLALFISSTLGSVSRNTTSGHSYAYKTSKSALNQICKSLSVDLAKDNIDILTLCPGWVQTDMGGKNAALTTEQSVTQIVSVIYDISLELNGKYLNHKGQTIPY